MVQVLHLTSHFLLQNLQVKHTYKQPFERDVFTFSNFKWIKHEYVIQSSLKKIIIVDQKSEFYTILHARHPTLLKTTFATPSLWSNNNTVYLRWHWTGQLKTTFATAFEPPRQQQQHNVTGVNVFLRVAHSLLVKKDFAVKEGGH